MFPEETDLTTEDESGLFCEMTNCVCPVIQALLRVSVSLW